MFKTMCNTRFEPRACGNPGRLARLASGMMIAMMSSSAAATEPANLAATRVEAPRADAPRADARPDAARIAEALARLGTVGRVLYVAAHPDDENTALLSYLANEKKVRAAYLSVTRGDGGQNLIGAEQGDALGVIRTQELLAARRVDGAEQFFTRAKDFGYSKTPEETLAIWDKDEILADIVWVIRVFRPDVIITRFPTVHDPAQHGHHTASARLAVEAFRAAADPAFHPEQLGLPNPGAPGERVQPWQARRILWNKSQFFVQPGEDLSTFLRLDVGAYNPVLGESYGEMAAESRSMHKSQGFGVARMRGPILEYFKVVDGAPVKGDSILEGVETTWQRSEYTEKLLDLLVHARQGFRPEGPEQTVPVLLEIDRSFEALGAAPGMAEKIAELHELLAATSGLWADAIAAEPAVAPGGEIKVAVTALCRGRDVPIRLEKVVLGPPGSGRASRAAPESARPAIPVEKVLSFNVPLVIEHPVTIPPGAPPTNPYWLDERPGPGLFRVADPSLIGKPESDPALLAELTFSLAGRTFTLTRPVLYRWTDPVAGERTRRLEVRPAVSVTPETGVLLLPDDAPRTLRVRLMGGRAEVAGTLKLEVPPQFRVEPAAASFALAARGDEVDLPVRVQRGAPAGPPGTLRLVAQVGGEVFDRSVAHIEHPHIPIQVMLTPAEVRLVPVDLARGGTKIGYIPGAGDEVVASLRRVGYEVTILGEEQLAAGALDRFDAIVVGVRAYNTNPRMPFHHGRLMAYVAGGGTLVAQYATNNRLAKLESEIGPYPFEITRDRVTDERAEVTFVASKHPVLERPNRITARDFEGWVQERGLYFAGKWDKRYETVLSMHDPGEPPMTGSLLVAHHGKGRFVYTGLSFFRQLPAGVPGAYRLFANLIAHGR